MEEAKSKFIKAYANVPLALRNDIVVVIEGSGPLTWNTAYVEIVNKTEIGDRILKRLEESHII